MYQIRGLTPNERKVISLINLGFFPSAIAERMKVSPPYVNSLLKKLLSKGLIQRAIPKPRQDGKREYHHLYELSLAAKEIVKGTVTNPFTPCRVHNLKKKIRIISQSGTLSLDKRTGYQSSWKMKGPMRHKFWYPGKAGQPSVTVDWHIRTLVAYVDKKQHIVAQSPEQAMEIGWRAIYAAVDQFVEQQAKFGVKVEVPHVGETIGKPHGGFVGSDSPVMDEGVTEENWWIDRSQEPELGPGHPELETNVPENMTRLDNLIKVSEQVDLVQLPEMFKGMIDPLNEKMVQLVSQLQGGRPIEQMFQNALDMMLRMMEKMERMEAEMKAMKGGK